MKHPQQTQLPPVEALFTDSVGIQPVNRDWSEGRTRQWDWITVPRCEACGSLCAADDTEVATTSGEVITVDRDCCADPTCERFADAAESDADAPMMNYSYDLPAKRWGARDPWTRADARKIAHLPVVIVFFNGDQSEAALALSGGGMDLSWEICEAFMRLGFLPPAHLASLPKMAGMPETDEYRWIIAGCKRSLECQRDRAESALARLAEF